MEENTEVATENELSQKAVARMIAEEETGKVSPQDYTVAVIKLVKLAQQSTSSGRAAAQVLLSAYNGFEWQLDVTDLNSLDRKNFEAAMTVIRGRHDTWTEPHSVIENGNTIFQNLWKQWSRLHVVERGKVDCPTCDGRGRVYRDLNDDNDEGTPCKRCQGSGRLCRCQVL